MAQDWRDDRIAELEAELVAKDVRIAALEAELVAKDRRIVALEQQGASLAKQVAELLEKSRQNSSNSQRPPSSDSPEQRRQRRNKDKKKKAQAARKRRGQPGHQCPGALPLGRRTGVGAIHEHVGVDECGQVSTARLRLAGRGDPARARAKVARVQLVAQCSPPPRGRRRFRPIFRRSGL